MNPEDPIAGTASLFLTLGDKTRLRLLNLMRGREVCVSSFTGILEQSQPLVSRHLAYLRNSGLVEARRQGKWIHYRISDDLDEDTGELLDDLFRWMERQDGLRSERDRYLASTGELSPTPSEPRRQRQRRQPAPVVHGETATEESRPPEYDEIEDRGHARHNELEDFLL